MINDERLNEIIMIQVNLASHNLKELPLSYQKLIFNPEPSNSLERLFDLLEFYFNYCRTYRPESGAFISNLVVYKSLFTALVDICRIQYEVILDESRDNCVDCGLEYALDEFEGDFIDPHVLFQSFFFESFPDIIPFMSRIFDEINHWRKCLYELDNVHFWIRSNDIDEIVFNLITNPSRSTNVEKFLADFYLQCVALASGIGGAKYIDKQFNDDVANHAFLPLIVYMENKDEYVSEDQYRDLYKMHNTFVSSLKSAFGQRKDQRFIDVFFLVHDSLKYIRDYLLRYSLN